MKGTIKSKEKIAWLFTNGTKFSGTGFLAIYSTENAKADVLTPNPGGLAFVAGKKLGTAPVRSRAKRRMREAARIAGAPWGNNEIVFVARRSIQKAAFEDIVRDMTRLGVRFTQEDEQGASQGELPALNHQRKTQKQENKACDNNRNEQAGYQEEDEKRLPFIVGIPRNIALSCIKVYRHAISPLFPPSCRCVPTCSEYAMIALKRFGFWRGLWLSIKRVGRCHPLARGGYDPVPEVFNNKLA